jgi:hypothetical protein
VPNGNTGKVSSRWYISRSATEAWVNGFLQPVLTRSVDGLVVADFNGDGIADVGMPCNGGVGWQISFGGAQGWSMCNTLCSSFSLANGAVGRFSGGPGAHGPFEFGPKKIPTFASLASSE